VRGREFRRPCAPADLADATPIFDDAGYGPPLVDDPTPWEKVGCSHGFEFAFTVRSDDDWTRLLHDDVWKRLQQEALASWDYRDFEGDLPEPARYVLVPIAEEWELRLGISAISALESEQGGRHSSMFSAFEAGAANDVGTPIRAGWLYTVDPERLGVEVDPTGEGTG
jgi:hypothetical protein